MCLIAVPIQVSGQLATKQSRAFGNVIATAEFSPNDFTGTPMEDVGARMKVYVADVAVRQDSRRLGLASKMLKYIETYCLQNMYDEIYLHVETDNVAAKNMYLKNGYVEIPSCNRVKVFTENRLKKPSDLYVLMKKEVRKATKSLGSLNNFYMDPTI